MAVFESNIEKAKFQEILDKLPSLPVADLEQIVNKASDWIQKKKSPQFHRREKELIDKIKNGGPSEKFWKKYDQLSLKLEDETMTADENQAFQKLTEVTQQWTYQRLKLMIELSKLWGTSLDDILKRLDIKPRERVYA